ncbi:hypothetical protein P2Q57_23165 [Peribacillus frigoritolerans]|nr:hypothetical protein [Peribacillus frigoritolerans]MDF2000176.1 hypothetical protein [Peribacillus frigoritolerans]
MNEFIKNNNLEKTSLQHREIYIFQILGKLNLQN